MDYYLLNKLEIYLNNDNYMNLFLKIPKYFPKNKTIYYVFLIIKLLPLIVATHDWNISLKLGFSFWIRKFTLAEIISEIHHIDFYYFITFILFLLVIIVIFLFSYLRTKISFNGKLFHHYDKEIYFLSFVIFYIFYSLSQFYISIFVENIFNEYSKKKNKVLYYIIIIIESIISIFTFIITFLMSSIIIHEPFFINSLSPLLNELGAIDIFPLFLLFEQIVVQLEFRLQFKYIFIVKVIIRCVYCLYYVQAFVNYNTFYYKYFFYYLLFLVKSCCFVSCVIEFIFSYDYNDELKILQKDNSLIIIKLLLEFFCGIFLTEIYFYIDKKKIIEEVTNFSFKNIETFNNKMIKFLNMLYYHQRPYLLNKILKELNISIAKRVHNPICKIKNKEEKCFYCHIYSPQQYTLEMNNFIKKICEEKNLNYDCIKKHFPILYSFFETEINHFKEISFSHKKAISSLFFVVTYIYVYEKNYYKCLFILEKILSSNLIKKSFLSKYQIIFFKHKLIHYHKNQLHNIDGKIRQISVNENEQNHKNKILNCFNNFKCFERIYYVETIFKHFLLNYVKMMNTLNDNITNYYDFKNILQKFIDNYYEINNITNKLFTSSKFTFNYPINKLNMFFAYFRNKIPNKTKKSFDNFFLDQRSFLNDNKSNFYVLVLQVHFLMNETSFKIKHASDNLVQKLRYSNKEFSSLNINEIFAKTFYKSYKFNFENHLSNGTDYFKLNNLCLVDKNKYVILFDLEGVTIYKKNGIELYLKLTEAKEQLLINKNKNHKIGRQKSFSNLYKKEKNNFCGSSFLFTNKSGKIYNLSRGFEDYFFLNTNVLDKYNINIMELLKLEKLDNKGIYRINLLDIYDNIYDIYLREVGQLGEDPFSEVILLINEFKKNISLLNKRFVVDVNYEEKSLNKDGKKFKYYYLFVLTIFLEETHENYHSNEIIQMFQQQTSNFNQTEIHSEINLNSFLNYHLDKNHHQFIYLSSKLHKIKTLSKIILNKFFKIKVKIKYEEIENNNNKNENAKVNEEEMSQNENYKLLKLKKKENKKKIEKNKFLMIKYLPSIISISFIIIFIILYNEKISRLKNIKTYFHGSNNALMLSHASIQMIIKIIEIQLKNNGLQSEIINYSYNNSIYYHISTLNDRMRDYLSYKVQFLEFYNPFIFLNNATNLAFMKIQNYSLPDVNGTKNFSLTNSIMTSLNVLTVDIIYGNYIKIIYNNSDYYFNESMIKKEGINKHVYHNLAKKYILIIDNFAKNYLFYSSELLNSIMNKIYSQINSQYIVSEYNLIVSCCYSSFIILFYFIFINQTKKIIKETFYCHTVLRFFNNYLSKKTLIILDYFDNFSETHNYKQIFESLEIIEDNEELILIKQLLTDQIYDFNIIRVKAYSIKKLSNFPRNISIGRNEIDENRKCSQELISFTSNIKNNNNFNHPKLIHTSTLVNSVKPKSHFIQKIDSERNAPEISLSLISPISITKQLMGPQSTNNLITVNSNYNSLNNNSYVSSNFNANTNTNTNTNNTLNTNSTNVNNDISFSKSNIPFNSNRTRKSTLRLLNDDKTIKKMHSKKNNIKKEDEQEKEVKYIQGGYKLLNKPFLYVSFFIELIIFLLIFIIISVIEIVVSNINNSMYKSIIQTRNNIFQQFNFISELFIVYLLSVLTNEEINVKYIGNDNSYPCKKSLEQKNVEIKNIYENIRLCYSSIKEGVDNITLGKIDSKLKHTRTFHLQINSENLCEIFSRFLIDNRNDSSIPDLVYLQTLDYDKVLYECENIGNGFNSKGLTTSFESIYQILSNKYKDFISDNIRTEISNLERLNQIYLQNIQVEIERVLRKIIVCYYIVFNWDYNHIEKNIIRNKSLIYIAMFINIIIIVIIYTYNIHVFSKDLKNIQFFSECIMNTILFI